MTLFPITVVQRNVQPTSTRRYELPDEYGSEDVDSPQLYRHREYGGVAVASKTSAWSQDQPGPMWATNVGKEPDTPGPSSSSLKFFADTFFNEENNTAFPTSNTIDSYSNKDPSSHFNSSDEVGSIEDDPSRILESFLNSGTNDDNWLEPLTNTMTDFPPLVPPIEANIIPAEFEFGEDRFTNLAAKEYNSTPLEDTTQGAEGIVSSADGSSPLSIHLRDGEDQEDTFSLSELDQFLPGPPPTKQPKYTMSVVPLVTGPQRVKSESPTSSLGEPDRYFSQGSPRETGPDGFAVLINQDGTRTINIAHAVKIKVPRDAFLGVSLDRDKLIDMPIDDFNLLLQKSALNDSGVAYMKEWRRKGKNKKAAKIARKRKRDEMGDLEIEVDDLKQKISSYTDEKEALLRELREMKGKSDRLENELLVRYSREHGTSYSRKTHHLFLPSKSNGMLMVPRLAAAMK